ncbi:MAG TPA: biotin-dependent carboxyltransferase family protein [Streptosporangiaceae bacterium]|nr:biotin-dependent carboxyltransferase family protein [Streptosporangiaceae bacterium]
MTGGSEQVIRVRRAGALTTVQDCGRPGYAHLGVPRSGALDAPAHHLANRLVGNPPDTPVLETTLTGVAVSAECDVIAAVTGALAPVRIDGEHARMGAPIRLRRGQLLEIRSATSGVRSYLAFSGGLAVPRVLGSASADLLSGMGPARLANGDVLQLGRLDGTDGRDGCALGQLPACGEAAPADDSGQGPRQLVIHPGPRFDWLVGRGLAALEEGQWTVSPDSNRVALRLAGQPVRRRRGELASEGLVSGAIQALPDGHLVLFLADHPTTGGYPVIAVVDPASLPACAQARPGSKISFRLASSRD